MSADVDPVMYGMGLCAGGVSLISNSLPYYPAQFMRSCTFKYLNAKSMKNRSPSMLPTMLDRVFQHPY